MATNPFEALLTPETLRARREVELAGVNKAQPNFWVQQANRAGADMRQTLRERGIGLAPRDKQAAYNQGIMENASQAAASMVEDGMDPDEARALVMENAGAEFMKNGNFAEADQVLKQASAMRSAKLERNKLKADIAYTEGAKTSLGFANAAAAETNAQARVDAAQAALGRAGSTQERVDAQNELDMATADLRRRTDPNLRGSGGSGGSTPTRQGKLKDAMIGWLGFSEKAEQLASVLERAQRTGTWVAGKVTPVIQELGGLLGATPATSAQIMAGQGDTSKDAYNRVAADIMRTADRLGVNRPLYNSIIIDLAYAHARANEPGGRISNNDFTFALQAMGAGGDAEATLATVRKTLGDAWRNVERGYRGDGLDTDQDPLWAEGSARARQLGLLKQPTPPVASPAPSAPPGRKETAKERAARMGIK